jgi:hypothetical protein
LRRRRGIAFLGIGAAIAAGKCEAGLYREEKSAEARRREAWEGSAGGLRGVGAWGSYSSVERGGGRAYSKASVRGGNGNA